MEKENKMSDPLAKIVRIIKIEDHPRKAHLSVFFFEDKQVVAMKVGDADTLEHRYKVGGLIAFLRHNTKVTPAINAHFNLEKLRVKAGNFNAVRSDGIHLPTFMTQENEETLVNEDNGATMVVHEGDDVSEFLGVTEYASENKKN